MKQAKHEKKSKTNPTSVNPNNWYNAVPASLVTKYHNPNYNLHHLEIPFRMIILGPSGSMKTNTLIDILHKCNDTFSDIYLCTRNSNEPLYLDLKSKIPSDNLHIYDDTIPDINELEKQDLNQSLIIFDDLVLKKNQLDIMEYFIRARKIGKGMSCIYISQVYYKIPKTIRVNCDYIIMKKMNAKKDLKMILSEYSLGVPLNKLEEFYMYAVDDNPVNFLLIDFKTTNNNLKFRKNYGG